MTVARRPPQRGAVVVGPLRPDPLGGLAAEASRGDATATRRLLEALAPSVLGVARVVLGAHHPEVEDAAQEALIGLTRALRSFRGECGVLHYACRIAVRTAMLVRRRTHVAEQRRVDIDSIGQRAASDLASPLDDAIDARRRRVLHLLLEHLPDVQAESLALRILLGCSLQEVAATTGAPVNTVRSRIRLAKEAIARHIQEDPRLAEALEDLR